MESYRQSRARSVAACGAAGSVVRGYAANNQGVRIRVLCEQPMGHSGALQGAFVILDAGASKHTHALLPLLGRQTDAAEVQRVNRRDSPSCISIANAVAYAAEEKDERQQPTHGRHHPRETPGWPGLAPVARTPTGCLPCEQKEALPC